MRAKLVLLSTAVNGGISKGYFEVSAKGKKSSTENYSIQQNTLYMYM